MDGTVFISAVDRKSLTERDKHGKDKRAESADKTADCSRCWVACWQGRRAGRAHTTGSLTRREGVCVAGMRYLAGRALLPQHEAGFRDCNAFTQGEQDDVQCGIEAVVASWQQRRSCKRAGQAGCVGSASSLGPETAPPTVRRTPRRTVPCWTSHGPIMRGMAWVSRASHRARFRQVRSRRHPAAAIAALPNGLADSDGFRAKSLRRPRPRRASRDTRPVYLTLQGSHSCH